MYTKPALCASAGNPGPRIHSCTTYARDAVFDGFCHRDARAIDYDGFVDRGPGEAPRHIGQVATKITHDTGQKSLRHWLNKGGRADTDEEREAARDIASEIARLMGIDIDPFEKEAA